MISLLLSFIQGLNGDFFSSLISLRASLLNLFLGAILNGLGDRHSVEDPGDKLDESLGDGEVW